MERERMRSSLESLGGDKRNTNDGERYETCYSYKKTWDPTSEFGSNGEREREADESRS